MSSGDSSASGPASALPSVAARALAFGAILLGGLAGGLVGWGFVAVQCSGDCDVLSALGALIGSVASAIGVAVVAVLVLRLGYDVLLGR